MAGPGGGPPRRSHTKSRKGCETCKRRHIRCDENFPQCRNCTKHSVRCPYMDMPTPEPEERAQSTDRPDLLWTPEIEAQILLWQQTGEFPFPGLNIFPTPSPRSFSIEDLRLLYHVASISMEFNVQDAGNFTIWTSRIPIFIKIGVSNNYVMSALLALAAAHIAWLTDCPMTKQLAYHHHGNALTGLRAAIPAFSRESSDAVLAASLLLSWQAGEWRSWTQLMHGTSTIIDLMQPWKSESHFGDFVAEQSTFPTAPPSPAPNTAGRSRFRQVDLDALEHAYRQLHRVENVLRIVGEDTKAIIELVKFVRCISEASPSSTPEQQFDMLTPLRNWLFWLPVMYLQQARDNPYALLVLAYYYTTALVVEPMFPDVGAAYFGSLSLQPIEEIARRLFSINVAQSSSHLQTPVQLIDYPLDMVKMFRDRLGWKQPLRTASLQSFQTSPFPGNTLPASSLYTYTGTPAFNYGQQHLIGLPAEPHNTVNSMDLGGFSGQAQYLDVSRSPAYINDYQTPLYQNTPYSDPVYHNAQFHSPGPSYGTSTSSVNYRADDYHHDVSYESQALPSASFAGTSQSNASNMGNAVTSYPKSFGQPNPYIQPHP